MSNSTHETLGSLFTDIANSIRSKTGGVDNIVADNFPSAIDSIVTDPSGDATATAADILAPKTAYSGGAKITGTMANNGAISQTISTQGGTYTVPAGYHNGSGVITATLPSGSVETPSAIKGTVSNHSVSVTPSVTSSTGYITGETVTGTAVTVSASELVSGNINLTNTTSTDVTNYATAQIVDDNLTAENIKKDVVVLGITGTLVPASNPETVSTVAELQDKYVAANVGKVYKYTGTTSGDYVNGDFYEIIEQTVQKYRVGGRIFYVDDTASGATYTFYDEDGNVLPTQTVAGLANAYEYERIGTPDNDKFYVAEEQSVVQSCGSGASGAFRKYDGTNKCGWATADEDLTSSSAYIDVLDENAAPSTVGTGRRNTAWINTNRNNSTYFPAHNSVSGKVTCWDFAKSCNENSVNGCNDWFVPSIGELIQIRNSGIWGTSLEDWFATVKYGSNTEVRVTSSSAGTEAHRACFWTAKNNSTDRAGGGDRSMYSYYALCAIRAF